MTMSDTPMLLPVALDVLGKPCLLVGGGSVALRKATALRECGASLVVVAPVVLPALAELVTAAGGRIELRDFCEDDCAGQRLVFACADAAPVNASVAAAARACGAWCNVAGDGGNSGGDFRNMATVRRGPIAVGITTSGASPALAVHLKERIAALVGEEYAQLATLLQTRRRGVAAGRETSDGQPARARRWRLAIAGPALSLLRAGRRADAERLIHEILEGE